jgi:hypothetical protein
MWTSRIDYDLLLAFVMAGRVPAIRVFGVPRPRNVDARTERGHDKT